MEKNSSNQTKDNVSQSAQTDKKPVTKKVDLNKKPSTRKPSTRKPSTRKPSTKKITDSKTPAKETPKRGVTIKKVSDKNKTINRKSPAKNLNKEKSSTKKSQIELPNFNNLLQAKQFCVANGLNKVDGYIMAYKNTTLESFTEWIKSNIHLSKDPKKLNKLENLHSPDAGLGEIEISENVSVNLENEGILSPEKSHVNNTQNTAYSTVHQETTKSDMPTAITENKKAMEYGVGNVEDDNLTSLVPKYDLLSEMKNYGISILHHINNSFSVRFHGGFKIEEYNEMLKSLDTRFKYSLENDGTGKFINISNENGETVRVPNSGYLPM